VRVVITALEYLGIASPAATDWNRFGSDFLGAEVIDPGPDGAVRLRIDDAPWRIQIHPGERDDVAYYGWSVGDVDGLEGLVKRLEAAGIATHHGDAELCEARSVCGIMWFLDPWGFRHEVSWGRLTQLANFRPGRAMSGFKTGSQGLGHVVMILPDLEEAEAFFTRVMGFRLSDRIKVGPVELGFYHCNTRHHTLAVLSAVPGVVGLNHLMLEANSLDDVGTAADMCEAMGYEMLLSLGRHTNDRMTSFYVRTPSGFQIEYGWGGVEIEEPWKVTSYDAFAIWGHKRSEGFLNGPPGIIRPLVQP
jgi:extradiol dioxygenase